MNPALLKGLMYVGIAVGGAGLWIGGHYLLKTSEPATLKEKLQREDMEVLDYKITTTSEDWNTKASNYRSGSESDRFTDLTTIEEEETGLQKLKNKCKEHLEKSPKEINQDLETKVKKWCAKNKPQK